MVTTYDSHRWLPSRISASLKGDNPHLMGPNQETGKHQRKRKLTPDFHTSTPSHDLTGMSLLSESAKRARKAERWTDTPIHI